MRTLVRFLLAFAGLCLFASFGYAQNGAISGKVTDSGGGILQGAKVTVEPGGIEVVSDIQGQFLVTGLAPGNYTVTVSYLGFTTANNNIAVSAGQVASANAKLTVASQDLQVLVTAERAAGEAEEINRELTADNLVQVLSSDVIRSLPNANMADALGRLPSVTLERDEGEGKYVQVRGTEPRLTNVSIDGIIVPSPENFARQIKLDAIPADIVESVEINKTLQANMDADGIGGSVNLVTKTAGERPTINVSGMGGYTPIIGNRPLVETTGTVGQRFGANKKFGALIGGSYDWNGRGINDMEPSPDAINVGTASAPVPGAPYPDNADLRNYRYGRTRWGFAGSADYKLAEGSNLYLHGFYSDFKNYGDRWVYNISDNNPNVNLINGSGGNPTFNASIRRPDYLISNLVAGGKHVLTTMWFAWDVSASRSRQLERGDPQANFGTTPAFNNTPNSLGGTGSACEYNQAGTTDIFTPQWLPVCFTEIGNPANFQLKNVDLFGHGLSAQLNLQATGAVAKRYHLGSRLSTIEVGGRYRNAHKFDDSFRTNYAPNAGVVLPLTMFLNTVTNPGYYGGGYKVGPFADYTKVLAYYNANPAQFTLHKGQAGPGYNTTNYDLAEKVGAGYVMNTVDLTNRIRLVAGLRFENTALDTTVPQFAQGTTPPSGCVPAADPNAGFFCGLAFTTGSYLKILPSASLRFAVGNDTDVRVVYGRGLGRPNPTDIAQAASFQFTSPTSSNNSVTLSNPNLKAETADNIDILIEHSLKPFGLISAGYFYKNLTDPIAATSTPPINFPNGPTPAAPPGLYKVTQTINAGTAWVQGFEAAYVQHLTFLPGLLGGLGLSANYGYTASRITGLPGRSDNPRLLRSAPNTWNISPTYDRGRLSVRAGFSYNQANIFSYQYQDGTPIAGVATTPTAGGINGPNSDNYLYSHLEIDIQGSYRLAHGLSFVMYGLDLNNDVFGFYNGSTQYFNQREFYKPTVAAGFRWSPRHEK